MRGNTVSDQPQLWGGNQQHLFILHTFLKKPAVLNDFVNISARGVLVIKGGPKERQELFSLSITLRHSRDQTSLPHFLIISVPPLRRIIGKHLCSLFL